MPKNKPSSSDDTQASSSDSSMDASSSSKMSAPRPAADSPSPNPAEAAASPSLPLTWPPETPKAESADEDPTMRLSNQRVAEAKADNSGRVYRVYCDGVFDLFHLGHMRVLEQAKKALGNADKVFLLAGVCNDRDVHKYKGKTVMDHKLRVDSVRHCKWVDEVLDDAPWVIDESYLQRHRIDFVAHDAIPYTNHSDEGDASDVYAYVKRQGMFLETQRTEGLSTSDLIVRIIRDYDDYVVRNLDRGYTKKELNIGQSWEVRALAHENARKVKDSVAKTKENVRETQDAAMAFISEFNPKYLIRRGGNAGGPRYYMNRLKENLPARRNQLWHHSVGLACALFETTRYCFSYVNPFGYCFRKKKYN